MPRVYGNNINNFAPSNSSGNIVNYNNLIASLSTNQPSIGFKISTNALVQRMSLRQLPSSRWDLITNELVDLVFEGNDQDLGYYFYFQINNLVSLPPNPSPMPPSENLALHFTRLQYLAEPNEEIADSLATNLVGDVEIIELVGGSSVDQFGNQIDDWALLRDTLNLEYANTDWENATPASAYVRSYFSYQQLQFLINGSNSIVFSLSIADFGDVSFSQTLELPHYFTIKAQSDFSPTTGSTSMDLPGVIAGTPCPPLWREFASSARFAIPDNVIDEYVMDQVRGE